MKRTPRSTSNHEDTRYSVIWNQILCVQTTLLLDFRFFLEMDPGETTNRTNGLHSLLRRAKTLYYQIMTKYGGVRWIFLHLGIIFLNIFFTLLLACLSGFGHRDVGFKALENSYQSSSHTTYGPFSFIIQDFTISQFSVMGALSALVSFQSDLLRAQMCLRVTDNTSSWKKFEVNGRKD